MFPILGTYLSIIAFCIMILSPVLIPALISGFHAYGNWRRENQSIRPTITGAAPVAA